MIKMVKMDLYRFFHSASTWIILFVDIMLAVLSVMLVYMTPSIQAYTNLGELLAVQISGGILMVLCVVAVLIFVSAKYKNGFIKNIANQVSWRGMLAFPEIVITGVVCLLYFFGYSIGVIASGAFFFEHAFLSFSFFAIIKLLIVQFILHWSFCCFLLFFYMITNSTAFTLVAGLLMSFKILNIFYMLVERLLHFSIREYMLDYNIFQIGMGASKGIYTRATIVGLIFLLAESIFLCMVMHKKDIK